MCYVGFVVDGSYVILCRVVVWWIVWCVGIVCVIV